MSGPGRRGDLSSPLALGGGRGTLPASTTLEGISGSSAPISIYEELGGELDWRRGGQS